MPPSARLPITRADSPAAEPGSPPLSRYPKMDADEARTMMSISPAGIGRRGEHHRRRLHQQHQEHEKQTAVRQRQGPQFPAESGKQRHPAPGAPGTFRHRGHTLLSDYPIPLLPDRSLSARLTRPVSPLDFPWTAPLFPVLRRFCPRKQKFVSRLLFLTQILPEIHKNTLYFGHTFIIYLLFCAKFIDDLLQI